VTRFTYKSGIKKANINSKQAYKRLAAYEDIGLSPKEIKNLLTLFAKQQILFAYEMFNNDDISTERLLAMVSDATGADIDEVVYVLQEAQEIGGDGA
jgi:hypothetical protein